MCVFENVPLLTDNWKGKPMMLACFVFILKDGLMVIPFYIIINGCFKIPEKIAFSLFFEMG